MLLTIIVPVYKTQPYLRRCVDSVLIQTFSDIEVILVDDGSPDACPSICDEYAKKDKRIRVIHKENGGLSDARNAGTAIATGDYILYLDSDDYWDDKHALSKIESKLLEKAVDVLLFGCKDFNAVTEKAILSKNNYSVDFLENSARREALKYLFSSGLFPGAAWLIAVKRRILSDNGISFIKGLKGEDYDWLLNVFLHSESFSAINDPFYVYTKYRPDSITGTSDIKSIQGLLTTAEKWLEILASPAFDEIREAVYGHLAYMLSTGMVTCSKLKGTERKKAVEYLKKYRYLFTYSHNSKVKLINLVIRTLGINAAIVFSGIYYARLKKR